MCADDHDLFKTLLRLENGGIGVVNVYDESVPKRLVFGVDNPPPLYG